jgi:hypothetical protein
VVHDLIESNEEKLYGSDRQLGTGMHRRDWVGLAALGLLLLAVVLVAPFGFKPDWVLVDGYAQWIMAVASIGSVLISSVALIAAAFAYAQNKEANDLTRQQMYASTRPFLKISEVTLGEYRSPDHGHYAWFVNATVENTSDFPATEVSMTFDIRKMPLYLGTNHSVATLCADYASRQKTPATIIVPGSSSRLMEIGNDDLPVPDRHRGLMLSVAVRYKSNLNPDYYSVGAAFRIGTLADLFVHASQDQDEQDHPGVLIEESQVAT